jgi:hypothetical protein
LKQLFTGLSIFGASTLALGGIRPEGQTLTWRKDGDIFKPIAQLFTLGNIGVALSVLYKVFNMGMEGGIKQDDVTPVGWGLLASLFVGSCSLAEYTRRVLG